MYKFYTQFSTGTNNALTNAMVNTCIQLSPLDVLTIGSDLELIHHVTYRGIEFKVSNSGKVWACAYTDTRGSLRREKICHQVKSQYGYMTIGIKRNYKSMCIRVHRLVAKAFLDDYCEELHVDHINRVRDDNRIINLRMATHLENMQNTERNATRIFHSLQNKAHLGKISPIARETKSGTVWQSRVKVNGKYTYFGTYKTKERAIEIAILNGLNL